MVKQVGPFGNVIRPFTINAAQTLCFVNVNELLGFEVGDLKSGKMLHHVEVTGFEKGPVKRHGCPSHGVGLTPDEKELWLSDGPNARLHIFDATVMPPKQVATIALRDQPGLGHVQHRWQIRLPVDRRDHRHEDAKGGDDALPTSNGGQVQSEKVVEVVMAQRKGVRTGDQFGIGRKKN